VEVLLWVVAAGYALQNLDSIYHMVGYAAGFATGNYVGVTLEERIALGLVVVRAIIPDEVDQTTVRVLRDAGYKVTQLEGHGRDGPVDVLNTVVPRRETAAVIEHIETHAPQAFVTVEEVRTMRAGRVRPRLHPFRQIVRR